MERNMPLQYPKDLSQRHHNCLLTE